MVLSSSDSSRSEKWDIYKSETTVVYGRNNEISIAENIAAILQLQDRELTRKFSNTKLVPDALLDSQTAKDENSNIR
jgi:hypothetical protein